jgi:hypothetical protein
MLSLRVSSVPFSIVVSLSPEGPPAAGASSTASATPMISPPLSSVPHSVSRPAAAVAEAAGVKYRFLAASGFSKNVKYTQNIINYIQQAAKLFLFID